MKRAIASNIDLDTALFSALSLLREPEKYNISWEGEVLIVRTPDRWAAHRATQAFQAIHPEPLSAFIVFCGDRVWCPSCPSLVSTDNRRRKQYSSSMNKTLEISEKNFSFSAWGRNQASRAILAAIPDICIVHRADEEFLFTAIKPNYSEKRLNKPIDKLIGKPLATIDAELADIRKHYLRKAIASGSNQSYSYSHDWQGMTWRFNVNMAYLHGYQEVLCIVSDAEDWQPRWWQSQATAS